MNNAANRGRRRQVSLAESNLYPTRREVAAELPPYFRTHTQGTSTLRLLPR